MKVSIITVCSNSVATLVTAMESVFDQTYQDIEYIVVDGGSTDGTVELLGRYAEEKFVSSLVRECVSEGDRSQRSEIGGQRSEGPRNLNPEPCTLPPKHPIRMRWISEPDEGMYDAINKGIRLATGDVVGILNADDVLADDGVIERISQEFQSAEQHCLNALLPYCLIKTGKDSNQKNEAQKIDVVYGDVRFVRECANARMRECVNESIDDCTDKKIRQSGNKEIRQFSNALASLRNAKTLRYYSAKRWKPWMLRWGFMPPHPGVYIRRELFEKWGYYKLGYHIAADYELLIRFLRKEGLNMRYLDACVVGMRLGGKSTKSWRSNVLLNQEIVRGSRENGYFCCMLMLLPKYAFKVFEFIIPWLKN